MPETTPAKNENAHNNRLPCRGCTANCLNYSICNGTPWRMAESVVKQDKDAR